MIPKTHASICSGIGGGNTKTAKKMKSEPLIAQKLLYIDLFCGAGGTSTGVENARRLW